MNDTPIVRLGAELKRRRRAAGLSQEQLAEAAGYPGARAVISKAENHHKPLMSPEFAADVDRCLGAGSSLVRLRNEAWLREQAEKLEVGTVDAELVEQERSTSEDEGVTETNRRQFVEFSALAALAISAQKRIDAGDPDDATLDDLESDVDDIALAYGSAADGDLLPTVAGRWRLLGTILDGHVSLPVRPRVLELRGQFTYFLGRLAFNANDMRSARRFASLAGRYADEVGSPVLILSVAALRSSIAFHTRRIGKAVDVLRQVQHITDPYMDARMAAYLARALAKQGDHAGARAALDRMEATACTMSPMPGSTPVGPAAVAMFRSGVGISLGDVGMAGEWAPIAVDWYQRRGGDYNLEEAQHAQLTIALVHLADRRAEPEQAARIAHEILTATSAQPTHTVAKRLRQCVGAFAPAHHRLPEVAAFVDECRMLPAGSGAR